MRSLGRRLHDELPEDWLWCGRRVKVVDGTTVSMPDTAANQREYPQSPSQEPGLGFPIARMVVVFCLATGAALEVALGKYQGKQTGENSLFRTLHDLLQEGDVVLADRYFSGWFDLALLLERGVHSVRRELAPVQSARTQTDHFLFPVNHFEGQVWADLDHDHVDGIRADVDGGQAHDPVLQL